jgi:hypothetical protein
MNDREFLKKIRKLHESGERIELTNFPVNSVGVISESKNKFRNLLNEQDIQTVEPDEQRDEESKFKDIVSKLVKFKPIKVHKENVEWSGYLIREKIDWYFSLDDTIGCYIDTTELIQLRDETLEVLKKLRGYYDVWSEEWSNRLTGGSADEENLEGEDGLSADEGDSQNQSGFGF